MLLISCSINAVHSAIARFYSLKTNSDEIPIVGGSGEEQNVTATYFSKQ